MLGLGFKSQYYDRALDLAEQVPYEILTSFVGAFAVENYVHKIDPLTAKTDAFQASVELIDCVRGQNEKFVYFVGRFEAVLSVAISKSGGLKLPSFFTTLLLLKNAKVEHSSRISIFSAVKKNVAIREDASGGFRLFGLQIPRNNLINETPLTSNKAISDSIERTLRLLSFEDVASIIRACDSPKERPYDNQFRASAQLQKMSPARFEKFMKTQECFSCGQLGHWAKIPTFKGRKGSASKDSE